jgi:type I restriction enzyme S subunit
MKFQKAIHRVRPGPKLDNRYFVHQLMADYFSGRLADYYTGATIKHLTGQDLARYEFPLPPLIEQRRIAAILDKADALRTKRRAALAQLDTLTQSIFLEMFGDDPATNPKRLPTNRLGKLCTRITDGTHQPPMWSPTGNPFLFVSNIVTGEITFDTQKLISDETHAALTARCPIEVGDVLYSTVGSYGIPALVRTRRKFAFQRHIAHLKPDRDMLHPEFLRAMLASYPLKRQADQAARGVAQKTLNLADIRSFIVFAPSLTLQRTFVARAEAARNLAVMQQSALAELDTLFASLQHRAFQGEL